MLEFGTDGVRGVANVELTPDLVVRLGRAAARVLGCDEFVVGRDTRRSGGMLVGALAAGLASGGAGVVDAGVVPTPAVAFIAQTRGIAGAVVSASHNPFHDNGVKLFAAGGRKLPDDVEDQLEAELRSPRGDEPLSGSAVGSVAAEAHAVDPYVDHLVGAIEGRSLSGLSLVVDCANGAASNLAGEVFRRAGASVSVIHAQPDGTNINHGCGSTHPEALQRAVTDSGAAIGLAFDGDADRVLAVDSGGGIVDGDAILALFARDMRDRRMLREDTLVVTVMSNLGLRRAMEREGVRVVETRVGDRYVLEALDAGGWSLGGEQSGHIVLPGLATTGDGMLTGLLLSDLVARAGRPLAELAREAMTRLPQVLKNVRLERSPAAAVDALAADVEKAEQVLGGRGRVLVRASGTEPVVRVMVEAESDELAEAVAADLVAALNP